MIRTFKIFFFCVVAIFVVGCSPAPPKGVLAQAQKDVEDIISQRGHNGNPQQGDYIVTKCSNQYTRMIKGERYDCFKFQYQRFHKNEETPYLRYVVDVAYIARGTRYDVTYLSTP